MNRRMLQIANCLSTVRGLVVTGALLLTTAGFTQADEKLAANGNQNGSTKTDSAEPEKKKPTPFPDRVVMFQVGAGGGKGQDKLPKIVLGPPQGAGKLKAGQDVLSLGEGGVIVLEFVDNEIIDGPGPDFVIFENPFLRAPGNDPNEGFFELAKVEVSVDGKTWSQFPYDTASRKGCAGHRPVMANSKENKIDPTDWKKAGGDPFDLKTIKIKRARFIRITDVLSWGGQDGSAGFDLDAVAAINSQPVAQQATEPKTDSPK